MRRCAKSGRLAQAMIGTPLRALRWLGHLLWPSTPGAPVGMVHARITFHSFPARRVTQPEKETLATAAESLPRSAAP